MCCKTEWSCPSSAVSRFPWTHGVARKPERSATGTAINAISLRRRSSACRSSFVHPSALLPSPENFHKTDARSPTHRNLVRSNPLHTAGHSLCCLKAHERHAPALKSCTSFTAPHHCVDASAKCSRNVAGPHVSSLKPIWKVGVFDHHSRVLSHAEEPGPLRCPGRNAILETPAFESHSAA